MIANNTCEIHEPIEGIDKTIQMWTFDEEGEIKEGGPEPINLDVHNEEVISEYIDYCQNCGQDYRRRISSINNKLIGIYRQPCICSIQPGEKENEYKQRQRQELLKPFVEQNLVTPQGPFLEELQVLAGQNEAYELASLFLRSTKILGKSFLLSGATGRGKTQIAIAIANSAYKQGTSVIAIKATDLVDRIKRNLWEFLVCCSFLWGLVCW